MKKVLFLIPFFVTFLSAAINITDDSVTSSNSNIISIGNETATQNTQATKKAKKSFPVNPNFEKGALLLENQDYAKAKKEFEIGAGAGDEKSKKVLNLASKVNANLSNDEFSKKLMNKVCDDDDLMEEFEDDCSGFSIFNLITVFKVNKAASNLRTLISDLTSYYLVNDDFSSDIDEMTNVELAQENQKLYYQVSDENCLRVEFGTNFNDKFAISSIENATSFRFVVNNVENEDCIDFFKNQAIKSMIGTRKARVGDFKVYQVGGSKVNYY